MTIGRRSAHNAAAEGKVTPEPVAFVGDGSASGGDVGSSAEVCVAFRAGLRLLVVMKPRADLRLGRPCGRNRQPLDELVLNEIRGRQWIPTLKDRHAVRMRRQRLPVTRDAPPADHHITLRPRVEIPDRRLHTCGRPRNGGVW